MNEKLVTSRDYSIDWIRTITMLAVFVFHVSMAFNTWGWHVKNHPVEEGFDYFSLFFNQWIMPLFFVTSAISIYYSLKSRSSGAFLKERFFRLVIPLLVGIFLLSPPQVYIERVTNGDFQGSFLEFIPSYFSGFYGFGGNFAWMGLHLWFLLVLALFSTILLPLFIQLVKNQGWLKESRFMSIWVILPIGPLTMIHSFLDPDGLGIQDLGGWNVFYYLAILLIGFILIPNPSFKKVVYKYGKIYLGIAIGTSLLSILHIYMKGFPIFGQLDYLLFGTVRTTNCWFWILSLFYIGKFINFNNSLLKYSSGALMPFYILHQPIIVITVFLTRELTIAPFAKFLMVGLVSFVLTIGLYHLIVRKVGVIQFLFGVKQDSRPKINKSASKSA
ncbi:acyltransferase family protein [Cytobacillus sp. FJAT-54145]|uniref:Acyltransferase family protein n=1 Tax=Cytobacillus spartinae TaxID=3299023 RepID=A0ABW6KGC6_9BACI